MNTTTAIKMAAGVFLACFALNALATNTVISDVVVRQRWPWSRLVDIDYVLTADPTQCVDVVVSAYNGSVALNLSAESLSGDLFGVSEGLHRIVWDPTKTTYTNNLVMTQFSVSLAPIKPLYMIIDLTKSAGMADQIEYITEEALHRGAYGTVETNPVANVNSIVWTGVTNSKAYKTDKLVLRRVPADSYQMGDTQDGTKNVTLTKHMYVGVFEVTQQQWSRIMTGGTSSMDTFPKHTVSYYEIRENSENENNPDINWPSNTAVYANSFIGKLRARTGFSDFDLPTEAQWEYFCRASTTTVFNDGNADAKYTGDEEDNNGNTNKYLNVLGWYKYNKNSLQSVGGKRPNAWGLYDAHGNVMEWCLDWYASSLSVGVDPKGAVSGSYRILRSGGWNYNASSCRSACRHYTGPEGQNSPIGFRIVRTMP
ncbi:MAG: formylglycine-generating enzyme family protein [Kiritimatiellia bacterium]